MFTNGECVKIVESFYESVPQVDDMIGKIYPIDSQFAITMDGKDQIMYVINGWNFTASGIEKV